ncbi:hypothetical protein B0T18DRAFT_487869 [Schizothecium vesticola]|uniref:Uncharacterized protein n=1 Tax=Schizothecium vesticola TaxID=314040 RepID=A0AA40K978_9PEZI|nr:hypothetical protein B0T18DRAFT_487869 [Schizothecium vesticola]
MCRLIIWRCPGCGELANEQQQLFCPHESLLRCQGRNFSEEEELDPQEFPLWSCSTIDCGLANNASQQDVTIGRVEHFRSDQIRTADDAVERAFRSTQDFSKLTSSSIFENDTRFPKMRAWDWYFRSAKGRNPETISGPVPIPPAISHALEQLRDTITYLNSVAPSPQRLYDKEKDLLFLLLEALPFQTGVAVPMLWITGEYLPHRAGREEFLDDQVAMLRGREDAGMRWWRPRQRNLLVLGMEEMKGRVVTNKVAGNDSNNDDDNRYDGQEEDASADGADPGDSFPAVEEEDMEGRESSGSDDNYEIRRNDADLTPPRRGFKRGRAATTKRNPGPETKKAHRTATKRARGRASTNSVGPVPVDDGEGYIGLPGDALVTDEERPWRFKRLRRESLLRGEGKGKIEVLILDRGRTRHKTPRHPSIWIGTSNFYQLPWNHTSESPKYPRLDHPSYFQHYITVRAISQAAISILNRTTPGVVSRARKITSTAGTGPGKWKENYYITIFAHRERQREWRNAVSDEKDTNSGDEELNDAEKFPEVSEEQDASSGDKHAEPPHLLASGPGHQSGNTHQSTAAAWPITSGPDYVTPREQAFRFRSGNQRHYHVQVDVTKLCQHLQGMINYYMDRIHQDRETRSSPPHLWTVAEKRLLYILRVSMAAEFQNSLDDGSGLSKHQIFITNPIDRKISDFRINTQNPRLSDDDWPVVDPGGAYEVHGGCP